MAIGVVDTNFTSQATYSSPVTFTLDSVGADLVLAQTNGNTTTATAVSFDGGGLSARGAQSQGNARQNVWDLVSPNEGSGLTVSCTVTGAPTAFGAGAISLSGVDTGGAFGTDGVGAGASTGPTATASGGDLYVGFMYENATAGISASPGTIRYTNTTNRSFECCTDASGTLSWTLASSQDWCVRVVALLDAPAAAPCTPDLTLLGVGRCGLIAPPLLAAERWLRHRKNRLQRGNRIC